MYILYTIILIGVNSYLLKYDKYFKIKIIILVINLFNNLRGT